MIEQQGLADFLRMADALAPWLEQIVVIGGWAHRLYQLHPLAQNPEHVVLTTLDADIAIPEGLPRKVDGDMRERLLKAGFKEEFLGEENPPATHFTLGAEGTGFYAEFLTPLTGSVYKKGKRDATAKIAGVIAQRLRYIDLLLVSPWRVELPIEEGAASARVLVANPAAFLAQKILVI